MEDFVATLRETFGREPFTAIDVIDRVPADRLPTGLRYAKAHLTRRGQAISTGRTLSRIGDAVYLCSGTSGGRSLWLVRRP